MDWLAATSKRPEAPTLTVALARAVPSLETILPPVTPMTEPATKEVAAVFMTTVPAPVKVSEAAAPLSLSAPRFSVPLATLEMAAVPIAVVVPKDSDVATEAPVAAVVSALLFRISLP